MVQRQAQPIIKPVAEEAKANSVSDTLNDVAGYMSCTCDKNILQLIILIRLAYWLNNY